MTKQDREAAARARYVCPECHAEAGKPCKALNPRAKPMKRIHPKRLALLPASFVADVPAVQVNDVLEGTTQQRIATARKLVAPPVTRTEKTSVQYRIESRRPGRGRVWHYYAFTGALGTGRGDLEKLRERIERAKVESPGLEYRITGRTVTTRTETTRWEVVA